MIYAENIEIFLGRSKMIRVASVVIVSICCVLTSVVITNAQGRSEWVTNNGDAQRSSWIRSDPKISRESLQKPGFQLLWKLKLNNHPRHLNSLTAPALLNLPIGAQEFRSLAFVGGSSDTVFVIEPDFGRMEWEKRLMTGTSSKLGIPQCPGGMTANLTRPTGAAIPSGGGGRRTPAHGAVGASGSESNLFYALTGDGMLHSMRVSNGAAYQAPIKFLPPDANAYGLTVIDQVAYVVTRGGCYGAPNGVWALDLRTKKGATWNASVVGLGGPAFGPDGTLYVTTGGSPQHSFSLVALAPGTLQVKDWYRAGEGFSSSPVIFEYKGKILIAATTDDGIAHLLDSASLGGADNQTPLDRKPLQARASRIPHSALASWQGPDGTRWILAQIAGPPAPGADGFTDAGGSMTRGAIVSWKIAEKDGAPALEPGWVSRDLVSPLPPTIINDVVFVVSGGAFHVNDDRSATVSSPAVLYALDALTGKELWNSGATIESFVRGSALSGGGGQFFVVTHDGTVYAFGFPMKR
jgi:outer membrane protein assembly factor BamB